MHNVGLGRGIFEVRLHGQDPGPLREKLTRRQYATLDDAKRAVEKWARAVLAREVEAALARG